MLRAFLQKNNGWVLSTVAGLAAFGTYSCMYAYRKAFAAGSYAGMTFWGIDYKILLVIAQVLGYMLSKFIGIRFVSGISTRRRLRAVAFLIGFAWLSLLGFAYVPAPYNIGFLFLNGLPLGMIWGLVFSYLEGRKNTEIMAAIMASSMVFASGFVKSVGRTLLQVYHVNEFLMPFLTGLLFLVPLCLFLFVISQLPPPTAEDIALRSERVPMGGRQRRDVIKRYWPGLLFIIITYLLLTVVRDIRDNFEVEIWSRLGYDSQPAIFTQVDFPVAAAVLGIMALLVLIKDNLKAFIYLHYILIGGLLLAGISAFLFLHAVISPLVFMSSAALGLYLAYLPCNGVLFERMISVFRMKGNIGFVMYLADAMGYLGSVSILFYKQFGAANVSWLHFFCYGLMLIGVCGTISMAASLRYFVKKHDASLSLNIIPSV